MKILKTARSRYLPKELENGQPRTTSSRETGEIAIDLSDIDHPGSHRIWIETTVEELEEILERVRGKKS